MTDAEAQPIADLSALDTQPAREAAPKEDRRFYVGLALATVFHSLLFAGVYGSPPRHVGDPGGSSEAISVAFVSEADLRSLSTTPASAAQGPPAPPAPPTPPEAEAPPPTPPPPAPTEAATAPPVPPDQPASQPPEPKPDPEPAPKREAVLPDEALTLKPLEEPPLVTETKPEPKPPADPPKAQQTPPTQKAKPERSRTASLDLTPPASFSAPFGGGGGAGLQRPPGITRSGENDAFARGVVSALQRTMPQLSNTRGQVTVRITLDMDGSLVSTQVVSGSNVAGLDRNVVFATRQTSYPFPPRNAKAADLVFLITYIYR